MTRPRPTGGRPRVRGRGAHPAPPSPSPACADMSSHECSPSSSAACCRPSCVMLAVALIAFTMFRFVGDPVNQMVGDRHDRRGAREAAPGSRPRTIRFPSNSRASSATRRGSTSAFLPVQDAGHRPYRRPLSRDAGACLRAALFALLVGIPMGVYTALHRRSWLSQHLPGGIAGRHLAADLPDRHPADLPLSGDARLAALLRARRRRAARLLDHRPAHRHPA